MIKPKEQIGFILPAVVTVLLTVLVSYVIISVLRYAAVSTLQMNGASERVLERFIADTKIFVWIFWGLAGGLTLSALLWSWWFSFNLFGPLRRLENELLSALKNEKKHVELRTRKSDALHPLGELLHQFLTRSKP